MISTLKQLQTQFLTDLVHPEKSDNPVRFSIYHRNWYGSLIKVLINHYPICERLTGQKFFKAMANQYVKTHYSTVYSLNEYGERFFEFIKTFEPARALPYLSDVAKLEWIIHQVFIGKSNNVLISSPYPIDKIWETNQEEYEGETMINLDDSKGVTLLVCRQGLEIMLANYVYAII